MSKQALYEQGLGNTGTVDGREMLHSAPLRKHLSEDALHWHRARIEIRLLIALSESGLAGFPILSTEDKETMERLIERKRFDSYAVAAYDHFTRRGIGPLEHDVKAVETYLRELFHDNGLGHYKELIHFPATSEDVNNLAWNAMLRDAVNQTWLPSILNVCDRLAVLAATHAADPVLGITHGMPASPTTFGKRFAYFLDKLGNVLKQLQSFRLSGKFSGPVGNHNAMTAVDPAFDMQGFAKQFVESFGFRYDAAENQRNSHMEIMRLLNEINLINILLADLCEHVRHGVMMGWYRQEGKSTHVGSSVMPHKINPWFFEVAQGYLEQSSALIHGAGPGLMQSVFERDLTDHPWERAYGEMIGKSLIAATYITDGLDTIKVESERAYEQLTQYPEIMTEAVQIAGRLCGKPNIYMAIKNASRGKSIGVHELHELIDEHIDDEPMAQRLKGLLPQAYTGNAKEIALAVAAAYDAVRPTFARGMLHAMAGIKAVLFDLDGTLHLGDKDELHAKLTAVTNAFDSGFSENEIRTFGDRSDYKQMTKLMVDAHNVRFPDRLITEDMFAEATKKVSGTFDHLFSLAPKAMELFILLKEKGYKMGLVTTRGSNSLPRILKNYGIADFFDVVINGDDTKIKKPDPEPLVRALEKIGAKGCEAVYIGDKQVDDVIPAKALDMVSILISDQSLSPYGASPTLKVRALSDVMCYFAH